MGWTEEIESLRIRIIELEGELRVMTMGRDEYHDQLRDKDKEVGRLRRIVDKDDVERMEHKEQIESLYSKKAYLEQAMSDKGQLANLVTKLTTELRDKDAQLCAVRRALGIFHQHWGDKHDLVECYPDNCIASLALSHTGPCKHEADNESLRGELEKAQESVISEEERQAALLALAELSLSRPGWNTMLRRLAIKMNGVEMFETFKISSVKPSLTALRDTEAKG